MRQQDSPASRVACICEVGDKPLRPEKPAHAPASPALHLGIRLTGNFSTEQSTAHAVAKRHLQPADAGAAAASGATSQPAHVPGRRPQHHSAGCHQQSPASMHGQMYVAAQARCARRCILWALSSPKSPWSLLQDKFVELHGDRAGLDDPAMVCGIGSMDGISFMFIGHQKGRNTKVRSLSLAIAMLDCLSSVIHASCVNIRLQCAKRVTAVALVLRRRTSTGTSGCPSPTATARRCGS